MAVSLKQFLTELTQSGVMAEADVTAFEQSLTSPPQDGEEFAKALIKHNRITKFQAQRIYQGKYKGAGAGGSTLFSTRLEPAADSVRAAAVRFATPPESKNPDRFDRAQHPKSTCPNQFDVPSSCHNSHATVAHRRTGPATSNPKSTATPFR